MQRAISRSTTPRRSLWLLSGPVLVSLLGTAGDVEAVDFLRGDVNSDGRVTLADAFSVGAFLFLGAPMECTNAGDVDDSGTLLLTDEVKIFRYLFGDGSAPMPPFPHIGQDPTENPDLEDYVVPTCESYGGGSSLSDPAAQLQIQDAVAPGGDDSEATITVAISSSVELGGFSGTVTIADTPVANYAGEYCLNEQPKLDDLLGLTNDGRDGGTFLKIDGSILRFGYLSTLIEMDSIPSGQDVAAVSIQVCLQEGTAAGQYPLVFEFGELIDFASGRAIEPRLVSGTLTVLESLGSGTGCTPPETCTPSPVQPESLDAEFRLAQASAVKGGTVAVPFSVESNGSVTGYSFSIDFDEEVLQLAQVDKVYTNQNGRPYGFEFFEHSNANETPGSGGVDEGFVTAAVVFSLTDLCLSIPPATQTEVARLQFQVGENAPLGETEIRFIDGGRLSRASINNRVYVAVSQPDGRVIAVDVAPDAANSFVLVNGLINIVPDATPFVRGDSNADLSIDISDASATLGYLFLGSEAPRCLDAADANDDARIDVSDPVRTLQHLFLGGTTLPPPFPFSGLDPTPDSLGCR
jgi:hypothetical protein